jgi:hypothetical protein
MGKTSIVSVMAVIVWSVFAGASAPAESIYIQLNPPPSGTINLSGGGATDWAYWGLTSATGKDEMAGSSNISSLFPYHMGPTLAQGTGSQMSFNFTGGSPDATATDARTFIYDSDINGPKGVQLDVLMSAPTEVVTLYGVTHNAVGALSVQLLRTGTVDSFVGPLPVTTGDGTGTGDSYGEFVVTLNGTPGEHASFDFSVNTYHGDGAYTGLQAASVSASPEPGGLIFLATAMLFFPRRRSAS